MTQPVILMVIQSLILLRVFLPIRLVGISFLKFVIVYSWGTMMKPGFQLEEIPAWVIVGVKYNWAQKDVFFRMKKVS